MIDHHQSDGSLLCGFIVGSDGVAVALLASPQMDAAYDILTDAGHSPEKAASVIGSCERAGMDPEQFARHMVKLKNALEKP